LDVLLTLIAVASLGQAPARPTERQLAWHELEYYAFCHFGPNTFTDREWGEGREDPNVFHPTSLDCRQWARTFKAAGMKGVVITAKHHDGFCLWPSKLSTHTVAQSAWKQGKGDVLLELSQACKAEGLKFGVYLSPWDRNHPTYGTPEYNKVFAGMLEEVLTQYGDVFEVWFDGACGEGPNGKRQVYDWDLFVSTVRRHQPRAVIFSDAGPDIRWVGNEAGFAGETNWNAIDRSKVSIGAADTKVLNTGDPHGPDYVPAECDVSIRPGWFYHASEDGKVKSLERLLEIWNASVGRGANLLLNVPPDRRGLIHENDAAALMALRRKLDSLYRNDLVKEVRRIAPGVQEAELVHATTIDRVVLRENLRHGQTVSGFTVSAWLDGSWKEVARGTTIGRKRIVAFEPVHSARILVETIGASASLESVQAYGPPDE
jgi:alpha-L-fucosidase